ncbi:gamma-glutamylcyclotransferase family protein [Cohnella sp. GCM10020058]|uniref:gamma-glutamylcyclotransferase family protein n=1 Tax=Cohnella sp. GCM10020058 TaxID=3317330 RepID=UPI003633F4DE
MEERLYFAYGSNLNREQMRRRCPSAQAIGRAYLPHYSLEFKANLNGVGVANIRQEYGSYVEGALYQLTERCQNTLDGFEGHPYVYRRNMVKVFDYDHQENWACTYILGRGEFAQPSDEYLDRIQDGYLDFGIPFERLAAAYEEAIIYLRDEDWLY